MDKNKGENMNNKKCIAILLLLILPNIVSAAANNIDPFSPGNAKAAYDQQSSDFKANFVMLFGLFWLAIGSFIMICFGGSASSYASNKSGQFADPEKKSGGASSMLGIILIVVGLIVCLSVAKPFFGF